MASEYNELNNALNTLTTTLNGIAERNQRNKYNQQVLDMSKDMQAWTKDFNERQFEESRRQWQDSFNFNVGAADLAQANFENATQIRANDMSKAGLNPLNLVGGAEGTSANFMSGSSPAGSASASVPSPLAPFSVADLISKFAAMNHDSSENRKNRESAEKIASIQAKSAENVAQINSEASRYGSDTSAGSSKYAADKQAESAFAVLQQRKAEFADNLSLAYSELDEKKRVAMIDEQLRRAGLSEQVAKRKAEALAHDEEIRKAYAEMEILKKQMEQTKDIEEKKVKASKLRSWLMFIGDRIDNAVDIGKSLMGLGGSSSSGHNPIGFMAD